MWVTACPRPERQWERANCLVSCADAYLKDKPGNILVVSHVSVAAECPAFQFCLQWKCSRLMRLWPQSNKKASKARSTLECFFTWFCLTSAYEEAVFVPFQPFLEPLEPLAICSWILTRISMLLLIGFLNALSDTMCCQHRSCRTLPIS